MKNGLKSNQWRKIWVHRTLHIEIQKGGPNNSDILQSWFPPEISSPLFNSSKFQDSSKSTPDSCRMHWNVMNVEEFGSRKLLKLKNRRADQIIQTFCKIGSPQKLHPPPLTCRNLGTLSKIFLIHAEWPKTNEWRRIWVHSTFKI